MAIIYVSEAKSVASKHDAVRHDCINENDIWLLKEINAYSSLLYSVIMSIFRPAIVSWWFSSLFYLRAFCIFIDCGAAKTH